MVSSEDSELEKAPSLKTIGFWKSEPRFGRLVASRVGVSLVGAGMSGERSSSAFASLDVGDGVADGTLKVRPGLLLTLRMALRGLPGLLRVVGEPLGLPWLEVGEGVGDGTLKVPIVVALE